ncbi:MAG: hypothetical protein AAGK14_05930 [Verrucomicrobiota bacterium]
MQVEGEWQWFRNWLNIVPISIGLATVVLVYAIGLHEFGKALSLGILATVLSCFPTLVLFGRTPAVVHWSDVALVLRYWSGERTERPWKELHSHGLENSGSKTYCLFFDPVTDSKTSRRPTATFNPYFYRKDDWAAFLTMLEDRFPDKRIGIYQSSQPFPLVENEEDTKPLS